MNSRNRGCRALKTPVHLTAESAAVVKGMLARRDRQHDIAAWFGVNGGRIGEIAKGRKFADVSAVHENLPPPGPYISGRSAQMDRAAIRETMDALVALACKLETRLDEV